MRDLLVLKEYGWGLSVQSENHTNDCGRRQCVTRYNFSGKTKERGRQYEMNFESHVGAKAVKA